MGFAGYTINKNLLAKIKRKDAKNAEDRKESTASNCFLCVEI